MLIVNKYGIFHSIPEHLFGLVERSGGRRATPAEEAAYRDGQTQIGGSAPVVAAQAATVAPWADYDSLNAEQVAARLRNATPQMVVAVGFYEKANKNRKTVMDAAAHAMRDVTHEELLGG